MSGEVRGWVAIREPAPLPARAPPRPSQIVHESAAPTPTRAHAVVTLERTSTGGTRRQAQFRRAAAGPMSDAVRAEKKRARAVLFPQKRQADAERMRKKDMERKQKAAAAKKAAAAQQQKQEQQQQIGLRRWPMSAAERAAKAALACFGQCVFCGDLVLDNHSERMRHASLCLHMPRE